jgi:hypothetical protein
MKIQPWRYQRVFAKFYKVVVERFKYQIFIYSYIYVQRSTKYTYIFAPKVHISRCP